MFGALKFRDVFSIPVTPVTGVVAAGSKGGGVIPVTASISPSAATFGNIANFKKWVAIIPFGSGGATTLYNAWWAGASASGGTFSMLPASSTSTFSASATYASSINPQYSGASSVSNFGSNGVLVMEIRGEYINNLNSGINWIQPILSVTNASGTAAIVSLAFESGSEQASYYDGAFVLQETDSF